MTVFAGMLAETAGCLHEVQELGGGGLMLWVQAALGAAPGYLHEGSVVGWGRTTEGQLNIPSGNTFVQVVAGGWHSLALRSDGTVSAWGYNANGETIVPAGTLKRLDAGDHHSLGIKPDGTLLAWGYNGAGTINVPPGNNYRAIAAGAYESMALRNDGTIATWGATPAMGGNDHVMVTVGEGFFLSLRSNGSITPWGGKTIDGEQNVPPGTYKSVDAGDAHSVAIRTDGTAAAWGWNFHGQSNAPTGSFRQVSAGHIHSLGLRTNGTLAGWGSNLTDSGTFAGQSIVPAGNTYLQVSAGEAHSLALKGRTSYVDLLLQDVSSYTEADTLLDRVVAVSHDATINAALEWVVNRGRVDVAGQMHIESGSTLKVDASEITPANGMTFRLFASSLPAMGTFSAIELPTLPAGLYWNSSNLYSTGTLAIVLPEPGAIGLFVLLGGISCNLLRRGRHSCRA